MDAADSIGTADRSLKPIAGAETGCSDYLVDRTASGWPAVVK